MTLGSSALVSVNANAVAIVLVLGIIILYIRTRREKNTEYYLFLLFLGITLVTGILSAINGMLKGIAFTDSVRLLMLMDTVLEVMYDFMNLNWFVYVLYMCFGSKDYLIRTFKYYTIPLLLFIILDVVNGFTGFQAYYDEAMQYNTTFWYVLFSVIDYGYIIASAVVLLLYRKKTGRLYFYTLWFLFVPVILGSIVTDLSGYDTFTLGLSISEMIAFMSMTNTLNYEDPESGFFNLRYFRLMKEQVQKGNYDLGSILVSCFEDEKVLKEDTAMLREILPDASDTIRIGSREIITLAPTSDGGAVHMLADDILTVGEQLGVEVKVESFLRRKNESNVDLLSRFLAGREKV